MENEDKKEVPIVDHLKVEDKSPLEEPLKKVRQIIIETDGNNIDIVKSEVSGSIEFVAILRNIIAFIQSSKSNGKQ